MCGLRESIVDSLPTEDATFRKKAWHTPHGKVAFQSLIISVDGDSQSLSSYQSCC